MIPPKPKRTKEQVRYLREQNRKYGPKLELVHPADWPAFRGIIPRPVQVWRSRFFLVQVFREGRDIKRLSVNRTDVDKLGEWKDGITWDDLQDIKEQLFPTALAVEIFPPKDSIVNVSNIRHLWVIPEKLAKALPLWNRDTRCNSCGALLAADSTSCEVCLATDFET